MKTSAPQDLDFAPVAARLVQFTIETEPAVHAQPDRRRVVALVARRRADVAVGLSLARGIGGGGGVRCGAKWPGGWGLGGCAARDVSELARRCLNGGALGRKQALGLRSVLSAYELVVSFCASSSWK